MPENDLDEVGLPAGEQKEVARKGILPQHALDQHGKPVDALAHVGAAEGQVHLYARRKQRHDARSWSASVISTATNVGAAAGSISCVQRDRTESHMP